MTAGTCTISVDAGTGAVTATGSGMALTIANAACAGIASMASIAPLSSAGGILKPVPPATLASMGLAAGVAGRLAFVPLVQSIANAVAAGVVNEITTNGVATITTSTICGRMPASTAQHTPIEAPAANVLLAIA